MKTFKFYYRCLGNNYSVRINGKNLNEAMKKFAKYYHEIEEVYNIAETEYDEKLG